MANPAVVQTITQTIGDGVSTKQSAAFGSSCTVGNTIVVGIAHAAGNGSTDVTSVTDTLGNVYARDTKSATFSATEMWRAPVTVGGSSNKITVNLAGIDYWGFGVAEVSGIPTAASPVDITSSNFSAGSTTPDAGTYSTVYATEIIFMIVEVNSSIDVTISTPSGFTEIAKVTQGSLFTPWEFAYRVVTTIQTSYTPTWTLGSSQIWRACAIGYKGNFSVPTDITGLQLWYKADAGQYSDTGTTLAVNGDNVIQCNDQSGNARNASSSGNTQLGPVYKTNAFNCMPVLRFSVSQRLDIASFATFPSKRGSLFMVVGNVTACPAGGGILFGNYNGGSPSGPYWFREIALSSVGTKYRYYDSATDQVSLEYDDTTYNYESFRRTANTTMLFYRNGVLDKTWTHDNNQAATLKLCLNGLADRVAGATSTANQSAFDFCEAILFDSDIGSGSQAQVETYLYNKWFAPRWVQFSQPFHNPPPSMCISG